MLVVDILTYVLDYYAVGLYSYDGEIRMEGDRLISTKDNHTHHGIGIQNVKRIIEDMHGELRINTDNNRFRANAFVYLNQ